MGTSIVILAGDVPEIFKENWFIGLTYLVVFLLGGCLGFIKNISEVKKLNAEIGKLALESIKLQGEHLERLHEANEASIEASAQCTTLGSAFIASLQNNEDSAVLNGHREALCSSLAERAVPKYLAFVECEVLDMKGSPQKIKDLIDDDVVKELERFCHWMSVINHSRFVDELKLNPLIISKRNLRRFRNIADGLSDSDRDLYVARIDTTINKLAKG
jgi:hypothetical protein